MRRSQRFKRQLIRDAMDEMSLLKSTRVRATIINAVLIFMEK